MRISDCGLGEEMRIADRGIRKWEMRIAARARNQAEHQNKRAAIQQSAFPISHFPVGVSNKAELLKLEVRRTI